MLGGFALSKRNNGLKVHTHLSGMFNGEVDENQLEFPPIFSCETMF